MSENRMISRGRPDDGPNQRPGRLGIVGFAELLGERLADKSEPQAIEALIAVAGRVANLTRPGCDLRSPASGDLAPVDIAKSVLAAVAAHQGAFAARGITVNVESPSGLAVLAVGGSLDAAVDLLCCWGLLRCEVDSPVVISVHELDDRAEVRVSAGVGVAEDGLVRLAMDVANSAGSTLVVDSTAGELVLATPTLADRLEVDPPVDDLAEMGWDLPEGRVVLYVHDEPSDELAVVYSISNEANCMIIEASSLDQADEILSTQSIDVVLVDQHVGADVGLGLLRSQARCGGRARRFLVTADHSPTLAEDVRALGAAVLAKPINRDVLTRIVTSPISHRADHSAATR